MSTIKFYQVDPAAQSVGTRDGMTPLIATLIKISAAPVGLRTSMKIRTIRKIIHEQQEHILEERKRLVELHAERNDEGDFITVPDKPDEIKVKPGYFKGLEELLNMTFEVPSILAAELEYVDDLCTNDLIALGDLFQEDEAVPDQPAAPPAPGHANGNGQRRRRRNRNRSKSPA